MNPKLSRYIFQSFKLACLGVVLCCLWISSASGQIGGTGWHVLPLNFKVQWPTNASESARYFFTNNIYHCLTYSNDGAFSIGNTTLPRTEQRFNPDYTNGEIQYQSVMMAPSNENSYCVFQIHTGDAQSDAYGSTTFMLFWFTNSGGSVHDYSGTTLATNLGNKWFQLNVDHNLATGTIRVWVNQQLVWTQQDNGAGDFYMKDGVYEQSHGPTLQMDTYITNSIMMWTNSGTNPPAAPLGLAAAPTISQIPLSWQSSVGATNYNLKRSTTSGGSYTNIASLTGASYTDASAVVGTVYYYVVTAVDQFGESTNSSPVSAALLNPGFQLSAAPSSASLIAGGSTNYTVTLTTNATYTGTTTFGVLGLPAGATPSFSPPSLNASGGSTLTISAATNIIGGNYPLTIEATNGAYVNSTTVNLTLTGITASPGALVWSSGSGVDGNWSDAFNWTNVSAGGYGPPGPSNNLQFTNTAAVTSPATPNNVVDSSLVVGSLLYANNAASTSPNYHVTQINPGQTLIITNGLMVGTAADSGAAQVVNAAFTGAAGNLVLTNGVLAVTQGSGTDGAHQAVLNLSGLGSLTLASVSRLALGVDGVPAQTGNGAQRCSGTLYLAQTNVITVTSTGVTNGILVGWNDSQGNGNSSGVANAADIPSALYLGQTNALFTDAIYVGTDKSLGCLLAFNPVGLNNPVAYIRNRDGVSRISLWSIGDNSMKTGSNQSASGTNDFSGGTIDALVNNLSVGVTQTGASAGNTGNGTGTLTFNAGTIDVNNLTNGWSQGTGTTAGSDVGAGTVNVNGTALLKVNTTLALALNSSSGTGVPVGTLNLNGGTVQAANIVGGSGSSAINLNSGTLDALNGVIANVSTLNVGSTSVSDPALLANAASLSVSSPIVVAANGTLAGHTIITAPGLTVNGTIAPGGDGVGAITNSADVTFGAGGIFSVAVQNALGVPVSGWDFLQAGGQLNVAATAINPFTVQVHSFDPYGSGLVTNFNAATNYDWTVVAASGGLAGYSVGAVAVDTSLFQNDLAGGYFYMRSNAGALVLSFTNNHPPVAATNWVYATPKGVAIPLSTLARTWSDADGDPVILNSVNAASTNGVTVSSDGNDIYYTNANAVADAITYTVADVRTNPPAVYRTGDTQQTGTGEIILLPPPAISNVSWNGSGLVLGGTGGIANGPYTVLAATNLTLPLAAWTVLTTNSFDPAGNFTCTNLLDADTPACFFQLKLQ